LHKRISEEYKSPPPSDQLHIVSWKGHLCNTLYGMNGKKTEFWWNIWLRLQIQER